MRLEDRRTVEELKRRLLDAGVPLIEVWAFGSRVRGDFDEESDLDVVLLLRERSRGIEAAVNRIAWEVGYDAGYVVSTLELTMQELAQLPLRASPLLATVRREGVRI